MNAFRRFQSVCPFRFLLLAFCLLCIPLADANNLPPQKAPATEGVATVSPGTDLWREVRQRDQALVGTTQVGGTEAGMLINVAGERWARIRADRLIGYAPAVLGAAIVLILVFYLLRGRVAVEGGLSGIRVLRFSDYERILHWLLAIVFLFLAVTGLVLLLGRSLLIPLFGQQVFAVLASASKEGHNLFGPLFTLSLLLMLAAFARRNLYERGDLTWLLRGGGLIGQGHVSGGFFNMGEKSWYWLVILVGLVISVSGLILVSPGLGQGRIVMEVSHVVHVLGAVVLIAVSVGHMYLGSVGSEGSADAMISGYVDIRWAEAHHDRWARHCRENDLLVTAREFAGLQGGATGNSLPAAEDNIK